MVRWNSFLNFSFPGTWSPFLCVGKWKCGLYYANANAISPLWCDQENKITTVPISTEMWSGPYDIISELTSLLKHLYVCHFVTVHCLNKIKYTYTEDLFRKQKGKELVPEELLKAQSCKRRKINHYPLKGKKNWSLEYYRLSNFSITLFPLFQRHITNNISTWIDYRFSYSKQKSYHIFIRFF
jgi:hypothetical protein